MVAQLSSTLLVFLAGLAVAAAVTLGLAVYTVRQDSGGPTYRAFTVLLLSVVVWTAGQGGRLLAVTQAGKLRWQVVFYVGVVTVPVAWFVFVLVYTGREQYVTRRTVAGLLVQPVVALAVMVTNQHHHWFYATVETVALGPTRVLSTTAGPYWWVNLAYSYLLVGLGVVVLVGFALTADRLYRTQAVALVLASLFPVVVNAVSTFDFLSETAVDLTPLAFALSTLLLFAAVFYGRFLDIVPVAYDTVVRTLEDGVVVADREGQVVSANPAARRMVSGPDADETLVGRDISAVESALAVDIEDDASPASPGSRGVETATGDDEWFWVREIDLAASTSKTGSVVTLTDITDRKRLEQQLRTLEETNRRLIDADSERRVADIALDSAVAVLDLPVAGIWRYDSDGPVLDPFGMTDEGHELFDEQPALRPDDSLAWQAFTRGELQIHSDLSAEADRQDPDTPLESEVIVPVGDWGVVLVGSTTETAFDDVDFDLLRLLAGAVERALARRKRERGIRLLQRQTSSLIRETSREAIAREAVESVDEALGLPLAGIHLVSADGSTLEGTAGTSAVRDQFGRVPSYPGDGESDVDRLVWDVFERGETLVVDDVAETEFDLAESPVCNAVVHPLGGHGVFIASSIESDAFDRTDRALTELFGTTVTAALDRVERERELRERERELRQQNERLDEFTSVVSHDLRSPLNQAAIHLDLLAEEVDDDRLASAVAANDRAIAMLDDLLRLARQGKTVENPEPAPLAETVRNGWASVPTGDVTLAVVDDLPHVAADHDRLRQVFENLFRNSVEHGGDALRVGRLDDGFYVADDGPGIAAETREAVFDHGYTTTDAGTGFGLAIVERVVEAHGWEISVTESVDGGARFEVTGLASPTSVDGADRAR
jgi:PAS domain S-box-containing protein